MEEIPDDELASLLANSYGEAPEELGDEVRWMPSLTAKQMEAFLDESANLLVPGNRFSGKGFSVGYACVKHAYDYHNALVLVVVRSKRQALTGGFLSKVASEILPDFARNINGFVFRGPRLTAEKDLVLEVLNRFGTWSVIQLMSILHDQDLARKVKGIEASLVVVDELTLFHDPEVYSQLANTLGRRNHIPAKAQRFIGTCNPDSPKHWVYKYWFENPDESFRVIEIKKEDNPDPKCVEYYKRLEVTLRHNRTLYDRDVLGLWVEAPSGDALFGSVFVPEIHVKGDLPKEEFIHPRPGVRCVVGVDIGDRNHGLVFLQERITAEKTIWVAFDEVSHVGKRVSLEMLTREVMARMQVWGDLVESDLQWSFISDKSAFDRFRAASGSVDHLEVQKHSAAMLPRFPRVKAAIKMTECPKPPGSVAARTRILQDLIADGRFYVSAKCVALKDMLLNISGTKDSPDTPDTHSPYKHMYDAVTYPLFYYNVGAATVTATAAPAQVASQPMIYSSRS